MLVSSIGKGTILGYTNYNLELQVTKKADSISVVAPITSNVGLTHYFAPKSELGSNVISGVTTSTICVVDGTTLRMLAAGVCQVEVFTEETPLVSATRKVFNITVAKGSQKISVTQRSFVLNMSAPKLTLDATSSSGLDVTVESLSPDICVANGLEVTAKKAGECMISLSQIGDSNYLDAPELQITGYIVEDRTAIICYKGKLTKKVLAKNPKCPKGYKKR